MSECAPTRYDESVVLDYVNDGDTITLADGRLVRLIGIDSPEINFNSPSLSEPFGNEAKQFLTDALHKGQRLKLLFDARKLDRFGRTLAYVYTDNGVHLQELLLRQGFAKTRVYSNDYFWRCFNQIEAIAREQQMGLWSHAEYRARHVDELTRADLNKWREIKGVVTGYERKGQYIWLIIDNSFHLGILRDEIDNFSDIVTINMLDSTVVIRGTLYYSYKKWQLIARHPSQITLVK